jgi:hypothetical protein
MEMDMRFGRWNIRSLFQAGLLMTVVKEISSGLTLMIQTEASEISNSALDTAYGLTQF